MNKDSEGICKLLGVDPRMMKCIQTSLGMINIFPSNLLPEELHQKTEPELLRENIDRMWPMGCKFGS